tara:strand:- start:428 stop:910 length:483 start_codon:yes stop_codon:yes gene_type:complete
MWKALTDIEKEELQEGVFKEDFVSWVNKGVRNPTAVLEKSSGVYVGELLLLDKSGLRIREGVVGIENGEKLETRIISPVDVGFSYENEVPSRDKFYLRYNLFDSDLELYEPILISDGEEGCFLQERDIREYLAERIEDHDITWETVAVCLILLKKLLGRD